MLLTNQELWESSLRLLDAVRHRAHLPFVGVEQPLARIAAGASKSVHKQRILRVLVARRGLPESPRWLLHHGKRRAALATLCAIEAANGAGPCGGWPWSGYKLDEPAPAAAADEAEEEEGGVWERAGRAAGALGAALGAWPERVVLALALTGAQAGSTTGCSTRTPWCSPPTTACPSPAPGTGSSRSPPSTSPAPRCSPAPSTPGAAAG